MLITTNPRHWIIYVGVSLAATLVIFFTVLHHTDTTLQRTTDAVNHQFDEVREQVDPLAREGTRLEKLAGCLTVAGGDLEAVQACQARYGG